MLIVKCITIREEESYSHLPGLLQERKINKRERDLPYSHSQLA